MRPPQVTQHMKNNDKHKIISYVKSAIRILSSITALILMIFTFTEVSISLLAAGYGIAEIVGILEESIGTEK